jgi:trk system potassium uptake protein TrkH
MAAPLSPARLLALSFGGMIATGTALLMLPVSAAPGVFVTPLDALFTATSAVCVTGLIVVDTSTAWSPVGHAVLLLLMQAGGLGYMTFSTLLAAALGRRVGMHSRATLQEGLNLETREELLRFAGVALRATLAIELVAALALALWWAPTFGAGRAAWLAVFHAVSAFNNAGFSLFPDNLMRFRGDVVVNLVVVTLIILGGLGFVVLQEIVRVRLRHRWSVQTKLVLGATGLLTAGGTAAMLLLEARNPATLGSLGWGEALLAAFFQAVSPRTAGFNTIDIGAMTPAALFIVIALMFIGASPGGTGGGVKTTTFGVTVLAMWATVRGSREPVLFHRRLPMDLVQKAFFITLTAFLVVNVVTGLLLLSEGRDLLRTMFETTSAFATVGLSMGHPGSVLSLAGHFSIAGKVLLIAMMFAGRVGPLTLAVALARRVEPERVRHAEERIAIG